MAETLFNSLAALAHRMHQRDRLRLQTHILIHEQLAREHKLNLIPPFDTAAATTQELAIDIGPLYQPSYPTEITVLLLHPKAGISLGQVNLLFLSDYLHHLTHLFRRGTFDAELKHVVQHPENYLYTIPDEEHFVMAFEHAKTLAEMSFRSHIGNIPDKSTLIVVGGSDLYPYIEDSYIPMDGPQDSYWLSTRFGTRDGVILSYDAQQDQIGFRYVNPLDQSQFAS